MKNSIIIIYNNQNQLHNYSRISSQENIMNQEEKILFAIFEGPVRPLKEEEQATQDEITSRYEERRRIRFQGYAEVLGIPFEQVEKMARENMKGLVTQVTNRRLLLAIGRK